ncbi:MAG: AglZ/HisF2 family acetamidino modification protein [Brumimicrobium sp.]|nr:AglZ/HisF2 family acetamidino modification protein [Brumimicrobium sp.]
MKRIRVIPVLLIRNGGLVKSVQFKKHKYVGDPINAVKIFNEKEVDEIIILDIDASVKKQAPNFKLVEEICGEAFMPLAYGGGVKSLEDAQKLLYNGAEKIVLNTGLLEQPKVIESIAKQFGNQSVVASIDYKTPLFGKPKVYGSNGSKKTKWTALELARKASDYGAGEIMLNAIDRDGTYKGYDLETLQTVASNVDIPVIASGGAGSLEDFEQAIQQGAAAVAAGSMFVFQRPHQAVLISYPDPSELNKLNENI